MRRDLDLRISDVSEPRERRQVGELLQAIFEIDLRPFEALDIWIEGYRGFSYLDGERIVANVGILPLPMMLAGRAVTLGGVQSVATLPAYRGGGLFTDLMTRALAFCEARYPAMLLYTEIPELYEPFGFRLLEQRQFSATLEAAGPTPAMRRLCLDAAADVALIRRLFAARGPVSERLGLLDNEAAFFWNALWHRGWRLCYLPQLDALLVVEESGPVTRLLDVVAAALPPADVLAAALGGARRLEVLFPPDRLDGCFEPLPYRDPEGDVLMVRGPFAVEHEPFMLPPTAHF